MDDKEEDGINQLPPELWTMILRKANFERLDIGKIRLVSRTFKDLIDSSCIYVDVTLDGLRPNKLPHKYVIMGAIVAMQNLHHPSDIEKYNLKFLLHVSFTGPCSPVILRTVLNNATRLKSINILASTFDIQGINYNLPQLTTTQQKSLNCIVLRKPRTLDHSRATLLEIIRDDSTSAQMMRMATGILMSPTVYFPRLQELHIMIMDMSQHTLLNFVDTTIIPFVQRHFATLQKLSVILVTIPTVVQPIITTFPTNLSDYHQNTRGAKSMKALTKLRLKLPEVVLNGVIAALFDGSRNGEFLAETSLVHLICEYDGPYHHDYSSPEIQDATHPVPVDNQIARQNHLGGFILGCLIRKHQSTLTHIFLTHLDTRNIILCNDGGFSPTQDFANLQELVIVGKVRPTNPTANQNNNGSFQMFQSRLLLQTFPKLQSLDLRHIALKADLLETMFRVNCPLLNNITLYKNIYYHDLKFTQECLSAIATKGGMKLVFINDSELCEPFGSNYWANFKLTTPLRECKYDGSTVVIMP